MNLLEAHGVWKKFGPTITLSGIEVELGKGLHVLAGPNGSGKTTLVRLWAELIKPSKGTVRILNVNLFYQRHVMIRRVGTELEDLAMPWWTSGLDYLKLVAKNRGAEWNGVVELARLLNVEEFWHGGVRGYSNGMKKRIIQIQALVGDSEVVMLDGLYTLIDRDTIVKLNTLLLEKPGDGTRALVSAHVLTQLKQHTDTLTVLFNGKLLCYT